jgi:hypothetical protein
MTAMTQNAEGIGGFISVPPQAVADARLAVRLSPRDWSLVVCQLCCFEFDDGRATHW